MRIQDHESYKNHITNVDRFDSDIKHIAAALDERLKDKQSILLVGCLEEPTANILGEAGHSVTGVDMRDYGQGDISNGFDIPQYVHLVQDIVKYDVKEKFDAAISISVVEHIGLGWYKDEVNEAGDTLAMSKVCQALKPGGIALITVPIGGSWHQTQHWRRYTPETISRLTGGFKVLEQQYFCTGYLGQHDVPLNEVLGYHSGADMSVLLILEKLGKVINEDQNKGSKKSSSRMDG